MQSKKPDCSIIIPIYLLDVELAVLTMNALVSIGYEGFELIIIDNASPRYEETFRPLADIYIRNKFNLGYPKAINQGIKLANGNYLAIANNDIRVSSNWWKVAKEILNQSSDIASVHFKMIDYDTPIVLGNEIWITGKERWCSSSFFVIKKDIFKLVGSYDEEYGLGGYDDWDLQHRIRHIHKLKTAYTNKAVYQHKHSSTQNKLDQADREKDNQRKREYFKMKWQDYPEDIWQRKYSDQMKANYWPFP